MHPDQDQLEADVKFVRQMEKDNLLFEYESQAGFMKSTSNLNLASAGSENRPGSSGRETIESGRTDLY